MYRVKKIHKRIWVINEEDETAIKYCAPIFLRRSIPDRKSYQDLADKLNDGVDYIDAVMEFETKFLK